MSPETTFEIEGVGYADDIAITVRREGQQGVGLSTQMFVELFRNVAKHAGGSFIVASARGRADYSRMPLPSLKLAIEITIYPEKPVA